MALDLQQRATQHGHRRQLTRNETESSRVDSTAGPQLKCGDYHVSAQADIFEPLPNVTANLELVRQPPKRRWFNCLSHVNLAQSIN